MAPKARTPFPSTRKLLTTTTTKNTNYETHVKTKKWACTHQVQALNSLSGRQEIRGLLLVLVFNHHSCIGSNCWWLVWPERQEGHRIYSKLALQQKRPKNHLDISVKSEIYSLGCHWTPYLSGKTHISLQFLLFFRGTPCWSQLVPHFAFRNILMWGDCSSVVVTLQSQGHRFDSSFLLTRHLTWSRLLICGGEWVNVSVV